MDEVQAGKAVPIAAVERDTGLSKDTLRVWERRYGFPQPVRGALAERSYPPDQVRKLLVLKRLLDTGMRPGRVVPLPIEELLHLAGEDGEPGRGGAGGSDRRDWDSWLQALHRHDAPGLSRMLRQALLQLGLLRFVTELVAPLSEAVGTAWMSGRLRVFEEHLFTESLQAVLRHAIGSVAEGVAAVSPRVLLATLPQESHGIGLLMAEALLALEGCRCVSLGVRVPMEEIVAAAHAHRANIVGLTFSASFNTAQAASALAELRALLPGRTEVWAGGRCVALQRRAAPGLVVVGAIASVPAEVARWRLSHRDH